MQYLIVFVMLGMCLNLSGQESDKLIQFSGVILTADSLMGLSGANIRVKNTRLGTTSNERGIFSFVAHKGDTILFSLIGYKSEYYVVPKNFEASRYSMIQTMTADTLTLSTVVVRPFIDKELFPYYFVNADVPDETPTLDPSLSPEALREMAYSLPMDGKQNQKIAMKESYERYYYSGQTPPINIMNPIAWAQFMKAWKNGDFKKKDRR